MAQGQVHQHAITRQVAGMSTLFISYSTKDREVSQLVFDALKDMGYQPPFRDDHPESGIPAGSDWEQVLYQKLKQSKALIVLCSRNWLQSKWCFAELAFAGAHGKPFFPVLIDDDPTLQAEIPSILSKRQTIRLSDDKWKERLRDGLAEAKLAPRDDFPWPIEGKDDCPYPGLESFEAHHAGVYFGRDTEIGKLREELTKMANGTAPRFLYVVGASGSGKSSLVKAGLLPRLDQKEQSAWLVFPAIRWNLMRTQGRDWAEQLAHLLFEKWPDKPDRPRVTELRKRYLVQPLSAEQAKDPQLLEAHQRQLAQAADRFIDDTKELRRQCGRPDALPLLVIDQFEELLSRSNDPSVQPFLQFLGQVMSSVRTPWLGIATVRTDYLTAIQTRPELLEWKDATALYSLPLMTERRFAEVIRGPAERMGIRFEPDSLVERIVHDTGTRDSLPLLAYALRVLYEKFGSDRKFTADEYEHGLGGLQGCLTKVADEAMASAKEVNGVSVAEQEPQFRLAFTTHLARLSENDQFVRRSAKWQDLPPAAHPLLQAFVDARLLTSRSMNPDDPNSERVLEVAHEALLRSWPTLTNWLNKRRELLRWRADLEHDQQRAGGDKKWSGLTARQFATGSELSTRYQNELTAPEQQALYQYATRAHRRRLVTYAILGLFMLISGVAWLFQDDAVTKKQTADTATKDAIAAKKDATKEQRKAERNAKRAKEQKDLANQQKKLADRTLYTAQVRFAEDAWKRGDREKALEYLHQARWDLRGWEHDYLSSKVVPATFVGHSSAVSSVSFSPDGKRIVSGSGDGTVKVWDAATGQETLTLRGHSGTVFSVSFSPDGQRIVSGSADNTVKVWDAATGQETLTLKGHSNWVSSVSFSPDGKRIVSGSGERDKHGRPSQDLVWDAVTGLPLKPEADDAELLKPDAPQRTRVNDRSVEVDEDDERKFHIQRISTGEVLFTGSDPFGVISPQFSPDGRRVLTGNNRGEVKVWLQAARSAPPLAAGASESVTSEADSEEADLTSDEVDETSNALPSDETGQSTMTLVYSLAGAYVVFLGLLAYSAVRGPSSSRQQLGV